MKQFFSVIALLIVVIFVFVGGTIGPCFRIGAEDDFILFFAANFAAAAA